MNNETNSSPIQRTAPTTTDIQKRYLRLIDCLCNTEYVYEDDEGRMNLKYYEEFRTPDLRKNRCDGHPPPPSPAGGKPPKIPFSDNPDNPDLLGNPFVYCGHDGMQSRLTADLVNCTTSVIAPSATEVKSVDVPDTDKPAKAGTNIFMFLFDALEKPALMKEFEELFPAKKEEEHRACPPLTDAQKRFLREHTGEDIYKLHRAIARLRWDNETEDLEKCFAEYNKSFYNTFTLV